MPGCYVCQKIVDILWLQMRRIFLCGAVFVATNKELLRTSIVVYYIVIHGHIDSSYGILNQPPPPRVTKVRSIKQKWNKIQRFSKSIAK